MKKKKVFESLEIHLKAAADKDLQDDSTKFVMEGVHPTWEGTRNKMCPEGQVLGRSVVSTRNNGPD